MSSTMVSLKRLSSLLQEIDINTVEGIKKDLLSTLTANESLKDLQEFNAKIDEEINRLNQNQITQENVTLKLNFLEDLKKVSQENIARLELPRKKWAGIWNAVSTVCFALSAVTGILKNIPVIGSIAGVISYGCNTVGYMTWERALKNDVSASAEAKALVKKYLENTQKYNKWSSRFGIFAAAATGIALLFPPAAPIISLIALTAITASNILWVVGVVRDAYREWKHSPNNWKKNKGYHIGTIIYAIGCTVGVALGGVALLLPVVGISVAAGVAIAGTVSLVAGVAAFVKVTILPVVTSLFKSIGNKISSFFKPNAPAPTSAPAPTNKITSSPPVQSQNYTEEAPKSLTRHFSQNHTSQLSADAVTTLHMNIILKSLEQNHWNIEKTKAQTIMTPPGEAQHRVFIQHTEKLNNLRCIFPNSMQGIQKTFTPILNALPAEINTVKISANKGPLLEHMCQEAHHKGLKIILTDRGKELLQEQNPTLLKEIEQKMNLSYPTKPKL